MNFAQGYGSWTAPSLPRPGNPCFSSGPTAKPPGYCMDDLELFFLKGRSHRSAAAADQLEDLGYRLKSLLQIPDSYALALIPGSATGAMQTALWNFLGLRGVDVWGMDVFSRRWADDVQNSLRLQGVRVFESPWAQLPDFSKADWMRDQVFSWCGTSTAVSLDHINWIPDVRTGLSICDATSAVLCADLPWAKLDVTAFSFQKGFGGEGGIGVLVLSPKAIEQLKDYTPAWPVPRTMRLKTNKGTLNQKLLYDAAPLNTLSMLTVADMLVSLSWVEKAGGLDGMLKRVALNQKAVSDAVDKSPHLSYAVQNPKDRAGGVVCLEVSHPDFLKQSDSGRAQFVTAVQKILEIEQVAFDLKGHGAEPAHFRLWCGPTVMAADLTAGLGWLSWAVQLVLDRGADAFLAPALDFKDPEAYKKGIESENDAKGGKNVAGMA